MFVEKLAELLKASKIPSDWYRITDSAGEHIAGTGYAGDFLSFRGGFWVVEYIEDSRGTRLYQKKFKTEREACVAFLRETDSEYHLANHIKDI